MRARQGNLQVQLAGAYAASSAQGFRDDHAEELTEMRVAAERAIRVDGLLAEAHNAVGMAYARDGQWAQSEKSFRRAIVLEPNNSGIYDDLSAWLLLPLGRIGEAARQMGAATNADPLSSFIQQRLAVVLICAGKYGCTFEAVRGIKPHEFCVSEVYPRRRPISCRHRRICWILIRRSHRLDASAMAAWYMRSRAIGFQPYFESGFPHGHDQFISAGATSWAGSISIHCRIHT